MAKQLTKEQVDLIRFLHNKEAMAEMDKTKTAADGVAVMKRYGLDMDEEKLESFLRAGKAHNAQKSGELGEEELKKVVGGYYYESSYEEVWGWGENAYGEGFEYEGQRFDEYYEDDFEVWEHHGSRWSQSYWGPDWMLP